MDAMEGLHLWEYSTFWLKYKESNLKFILKSITRCRTCIVNGCHGKPSFVRLSYVLVKFGESNLRLYSWKSQKGNACGSHQSALHQTFLYLNLSTFGEYESLSICTVWFNSEMNEIKKQSSQTAPKHSNPGPPKCRDQVTSNFYYIPLQQVCWTSPSIKKKCKDTLSLWNFLC